MTNEWDDEVGQATGESRHVVAFCVGQQQYGLDIMRIKEIINPVSITPVPRAPQFIEGIIELRGAFLPIVDLRKRFDLEPTAMTRQNKYVIVSLSGRVIGLVVDRVIEPRRIPVGSISDGADLAFGASTRFLTGCFKSDDGILLMLDLDEVLSPDEKGELLDMESAP
jgi:purine-binding chemotaxis protein CheW